MRGGWGVGAIFCECLVVVYFKVVCFRCLRGLRNEYAVACLCVLLIVRWEWVIRDVVCVVVCLAWVRWIPFFLRASCLLGSFPRGWLCVRC